MLSIGFKFSCFVYSLLIAIADDTTDHQWLPDHYQLYTTLWLGQVIRLFNCTLAVWRVQYWNFLRIGPATQTVVCWRSNDKIQGAIISETVYAKEANKKRHKDVVQSRQCKWIFMQFWYLHWESWCMHNLGFNRNICFLMEFFHYEYYEQVELSITMFLLQYSFILTAFSSEVAFTLFNYYICYQI